MVGYPPDSAYEQRMSEALPLFLVLYVVIRLVTASQRMLILLQIIFLDMEMLRHI